MTTRRNFIRQCAVAGAMCSMPQLMLAAKNTGRKNLIWANLVHLSYNMWTDNTDQKWPGVPDGLYADDNYVGKACEDTKRWARQYRPMLTFDYGTWSIVLEDMVKAGMNMVVIDLGDAVKYESHPEIAVEGAWSVTQLRNELVKIRKMGLEPIPKLNFATTHDTWLGEYGRMVSTETYYTVCRNLIREVTELFDKPRFFHLGMDEETVKNQRNHSYMLVRQGDLWWHDFYLLVNEVEKNGSRAWIWADYVRRFPELFHKKMPKTVLLSNWYYGTDFNPNNERISYYSDFDKYGFDQVPTGSSHSNSENFGLTVDYCTRVIDPGRLYGFFQTAWRPTLPQCLDELRNTVTQAGEAIKKYGRG